MKNDDAAVQKPDSLEPEVSPIPAPELVPITARYAITCPICGEVAVWVKEEGTFVDCACLSCKATHKRYLFRHVPPVAVAPEIRQKAEEATAAFEAWEEEVRKVRKNQILAELNAPVELFPILTPEGRATVEKHLDKVAEIILARELAKIEVEKQLQIEREKIRLQEHQTAIPRTRWRGKQKELLRMILPYRHLIVESGDGDLCRQLATIFQKEDGTLLKPESLEKQLKEVEEEIADARIRAAENMEPKKKKI
jgi:hypothetical protein